MLEILKKLIEFKTISLDHRENEKALAWIKNEIRDLPLFTKEFSSNGFPSLILTTRKTKQPAVLLQAHLDVVDGSPFVFVPRVTKNKLFGLGVFDMKFAVASYLRLLRELGDNLPKYNLGVMLTTDEEVGGENGVKFLLEKGYWAKVCLLPDGGHRLAIQVGAKGVWHLSVECRGKSVHGSRVWQGENAVEKLSTFLSVLKNKFPKEPCSIPYHNHNTFNLGYFTGGTAANKVPDFAKALVDIRFTPGVTRLALRKMISAAKRDFNNIKVKELVYGPSFKIDRENSYLKLFSEILSQEYKAQPEYITSHGSSDARFFSEKGIPVVATRPNGGGHHSEKEWLDLADWEKFYLVLKRFVETTASD